MEDPQAKAQGQHLDGLFHGHKQQGFPFQTKPAAKHGAPDNGRNAAEENDHSQFPGKPFRFEFLHGDVQHNGQYQPVPGIGKHHPKEDEMERGHNGIRVKGASHG